MFLNNEITLNGQIGPTGIPLRSNVAKTNRFGFETEWAYTGKLFGFSQSLSLAHHRTREENIVFTPLLIPKWIINNEIRFTAFPNFNFTVQNRVQGSSFIDIANRNKLPSFSSFNFIATIRAKSFDFIASIINVSNKKIYTNGQLNLYGKPVYHIQSPAGIWMGIIFTIK
jgi:iron complex outermembrane receptor protein